MSHLLMFSHFLDIEGIMKFTSEPSDPSYARKGSNAKLVWDYSVDDKQKELKGIVYSVLVSNGPFVEMLVKFKNGTVVEHSQIPAAYKGRVRIEGNASLVIENVSSRDNTRFGCALIPESGQGTIQESKVQLIVIGTYCGLTSGEKASTSVISYKCRNLFNDKD